ncbi:hypothetical protein O6H91_20G065100 [Diphasiastrum complanatum]|uniref:Uncharacterized protein n=1 Tax=Diphasiastrum complanatum TaxID=34168 RepID=A0ACC2ARG3_DIPCM|nr:hypothetical protein O6H91_20G065100 [Diphasiastrum complanatum]
MSVFVSGHSRVPPGFRFHPTDEELVGYYLQKKVTSRKIDLDVIRDIDLYKLEPWDLHERCKIGSAEQSEWYFFSHKDKKYPTGTRTNRATAAGFWKATGRDKAIHTNFKLIGMRKTLVFYKGRAPNGEKSDWIMHEYRLEEENSNSTSGNEDGWVVCRVFRKRTSQKAYQRESAACFYEEQNSLISDLDSPNKLINREMASYHQQFACKQEIQIDDFNTYHDPFSQMPQLESPKIGYHAPFSCTMKGLISGEVMRQENHPPRFSLECDIRNTERILSQEKKLALQHFNNEPVTDWRMVDRLAAAQLSQENAMKDHTRYNSGASTNSDAVLKDHDVALLLRLSKEHQPPQQFNATYEGDLWSFGR